MTKTQIKKALIFAGICVALIAAFKEGNRYLTKRFSPEAQAVFESSQMKLIVDYCQPSTKGRDIFGIEEALVPYGEVWRTGANEATTFTTTTDLTIDGKTLAAGSYTLWTIPNKDSWTVIFNEKEYGWGVGFDGKASRDAAADVLQVKVPTQALNDTQELFTIALQDSGSPALVLSWEKTKVAVPFE